VHNLIGIYYSFGCDLRLLQESRCKTLLLEKQVASVKGQVWEFVQPPYLFQLICFLGQTALLLP